MRTNLYNKCTNDEIEAYLNEGKDTLIIAVGVTEMHGQLPLDCETILAEAFALKIAQRTDSLAVINLPYFCAGSTAIGRGTFNMSVEEGYRYLKEVIYSFYNQGFRRMMIVSCHGPAYLTINSVCMDFFHETKNPIVHCELGYAAEIATANGWKQDNIMNIYVDILYGAYKIMNQLECIPIMPHADMEKLQQEREYGNKKQEMKNELHRLAHSPGLFGSYYYTKAQHGGGEQSENEEERLEIATRGEKLLDELIEYFKPEKYLNLLSELDEQVNQEILPMYPHLNGGKRI